MRNHGRRKEEMFSLTEKITELCKTPTELQIKTNSFVTHSRLRTLSITMSLLWKSCALILLRVHPRQVTESNFRSQIQQYFFNSYPCLVWFLFLQVKANICAMYALQLNGFRGYTCMSGIFLHISFFFLAKGRKHFLRGTFAKFTYLWNGAASFPLTCKKQIVFHLFVSSSLKTFHFIKIQSSTRKE